MEARSCCWNGGLICRQAEQALVALWPYSKANFDPSSRARWASPMARDVLADIGGSSSSCIQHTLAQQLVGLEGSWYHSRLATEVHSVFGVFTCC